MIQAERIGRFEVGERIRGNAFALVYRGRDPFDGRPVQIKFCVATDATIRRRFLQAAEEAARLRHPTIASVFEFGSGDSKPYLVQEAFSEETLSDLMARPEPVDDVLKLYYLIQVARALEHAHGRGVLHRELRPASVLVQQDGEAKLADFGIARLASAFAHLGNGAHRWPAVGWLLPELLLGLELDERSDIYGFGALAYELLTGTAPFPAGSLSALVSQVLESEPRAVGSGWPECPPTLDRVILRCLKRDPCQRFASAHEVIEELDAILPASVPGEAVDEEKTIVTTELQTVYVAEGEERGGDREEPASPVSTPWDLPTRVDRTLEWAAAAASALIAVAKASSSRARAIWQVSPWRLRAAAIAGLALMLVGVVSWSLVHSPDPLLPPVLTEPPPPLEERLQRGLLIIDPRPWAKVDRLVRKGGREVELPAERFTPLPIQLPPGDYEIELSRLDGDRIESLPVEVEASTTTHFRPRVATLDASDLFKSTGWWQ